MPVSIARRLWQGLSRLLPMAGEAWRRPGLRLALIAAWSLCLLAVATALILGGVFWAVEKQVDQRRDQAEMAMAIVADLLPVATQGSDVLAIDDYLHKSLASAPFLDLAYYSVTLGMSFDTRLLEPKLAQSPPNGAGALAMGRTTPVWVSEPPYAHLAQAVRQRGEVIGVIMATLPAADRVDKRVSTLRKVLAPAIGVILLGLMFGVLAVVRFSRPIDTILAASERLAAGILTTPPLPSQGPEVDRMALAVERLAATLRQNADRIDALVTRDPLTGLANRETFARLAGLVLAGLANRQAPATLILVEVIGVRAVSERHGDEVCDAVLRVVAERLTRAVDVPNLLPDRPTTRTDRDGVARPLVDLLGRMGAGEFGILLHNAGVAADVAVIAEQLRAVVTEPINLDEIEVALTVRVGISIKRGATLDYPSLRRSAVAALIEARVSGQVLVFADSAQSASLRHVPSYALSE